MNQLFPPTRPASAELSALKAEIRSRRAEFEKLRHIPDDIIAALKRVGAYRAFVPAALGGDELSPAAFCRLIEEISYADASTGWVASFGVSTTYLAALPKQTFEAIYGADPDMTFAGAIFPPQPAPVERGGFIVSGRWPYCSGCMGADYIGVGIKSSDPGNSLPRMAVMKASQARIEQVWDCVGLAATGSHDVLVEAVFVPEEMSFVRGGRSQRDEPVFRYPAMALASQVLAVVALGTAQEALDYVHDALAEKSSITGAPSLATRAYVQQGFAQAQAALSSARAYFYETIEQGWAQVLRGDDVPRAQRTAMRLAATNAAHTGADVARQAFRLGGTEALRRGHVLGRCMLDAASVAQHAFLGLGTWTLAGAGMLNQPTPPGYP
ncbi:acyl-CoA dehydrogenase family protein [Acidocella sp.]|uniref:acyl-CoA dehydrogenase family protein n=1 Tax=Acidocella sp. TaxID=50710 RepID=UPI003D01B38A